ncbi:MAG: hypothetical protein V4577_23555 [Bacteroidota bacterium]
MELDEFKDMWTKAEMQPSTINYNISSMIYTDSKSPLAMIEKRFKAALFMFPLTVVIFGGTFISKGTNQSVITWLLFAILFIEFLFSLFNYLLIKKIQQPAGNIRENLVKRVYLLEQRTTNYLYLHTGLYVVMAILLELSVYFNFDANHGWWAGINPVLRAVICVVFLAGQHFIKRQSQTKLYGQYIEKLHGLIGQMEAN